MLARMVASIQANIERLNDNVIESKLFWKEMRVHAAFLGIGAIFLFALLIHHITTFSKFDLFAAFLIFSIFGNIFMMTVLVGRIRRNAKIHFLRDPRGEPMVLSSAPGNIAVRICQFLFSAKAYREVFGQVISDMREEYFDALNSGQPKKARYILMRDHLNLLLTAASYVTATVAKRMVSIWKIIG